jgi:sugar (pentulose or hexulose) kinase
VSGGADTVWVGLDLGTSSLKAVALDGSGAALAEAREGYETARPGPGLAEQDPASWTEAARGALARLAAHVPPQSWGGIGLSGMIPTLAMVDAGGEPLRPALTWEDCRAHAEASEIAAEAGEQALYEVTGQPLDGRYILPMFAWFRSHQTHVAESAALLLSAKDYLFSWLTGQAVTDPSTATGYGCYDLGRADWLPHVAALAHVSLAKGRPGRPGLPPIMPSTAALPLDPARAAALGLPAGLSVCAGAADSVLAAEALGAVTPGSVAYVWGTSTVILGASSARVADPQRRCLITPLAVTGWGVEMDLVSTGAAVQWLAKLLGFGADGQARVFEAAAAAEDSAVPAALPFVGVGEQGALWDNDVRGTLVGLDLTHGPGDVARAVLDGIVLESRRCLERLSDFGLPEGEVRVAWRTAEPWFCRRLADASGREVLIGDSGETSSAAGAARLAAAAAGRALPAPQARGGRFMPDPAAARVWQRRWTDYEALLTPLRRLYRSWPGDSAPEAGRS